jgi:hypothetical protein
VRELRALTPTPGSGDANDVTGTVLSDPVTFVNGLITLGPIEFVVGSDPRAPVPANWIRLLP